MTLQEAVKRADEELLALEKLGLPGFLRLQNFVWPFILLAAALVVGLGLSIGWVAGGIVGVVLAVAAAVGSYIGLSRLARPRVARHYFPLRQTLDDAERLLDQTKDWIKTEFERQQRDRAAPGKRGQESRRDPRPPARRGRGPPAARQAGGRRQVPGPAGRARPDARRRAEAGRRPLSSPDQGPGRDLPARHRTGSRSLTARPGRRPSSCTTHAWNNLIRTWTEGLARVGGVAGDVNEESSRRFLDWDKTQLDHWTPPAEVPPALPFGRFTDRPGRLPRRRSRRSPAQGRRADAAGAAGTDPVSHPVFGADQDGRHGQGRGGQAAPGADAPLPHLGAAGQGPVHDLRPGRPGRELRRVHAPGRLPRAPGHQPDLDRDAAHRAAAGRPPAAHGERDPEVPPQRVRDDRGVQRLRRRGGRAVPRAGGGQLPRQLQRVGRAAADQHRQQRGTLRRLRPDLAGHQAAAAVGMPGSRTSSRTA